MVRRYETRLTVDSHKEISSEEILRGSHRRTSMHRNRDEQLGLVPSLLALLVQPSRMGGALMPAISTSSYTAFRTCPRLYYWRFVLRIVLVREEGARRFGTMFHAGEEAWWRAMDGGDVPWRDQDAALVAALKAIADNARHVRTDPFEVAKAEAMMVAYHARYFGLDFETVHGSPDESVEVWFDVPMFDESRKVVPGWRVHGRMDAIKRFADGRVKPVEHKTTSSEIHGASDYWARLAIDNQCSIYVDVAQLQGLNAREALYDVARKPELRPLLATPEEKREMTKGKGCRHCGGRAGGKLGSAAGTGKVMVRTKVDADGLLLPNAVDVEVTCTACSGSGWEPGSEPRLHKKQRTEDESVDDYRRRVADTIAADPDAFFRQGSLTRSDDQLAESRADLRITSGEIGALTELARQATKEGDLADTKARRCFPRNTSACTSIYGRRCDYIEVCTGAVDPWKSPLFQIRMPSGKRETHVYDEKGVETVKKIGPGAIE